MRGLTEKLITLWQRWERTINLGSLAVGFAFDLYLAKRPDSVPDNILLLFYLFISASVIVVFNLRKTRRQQQEEHPAQPLVLILILQFCFGGLASNMLILYGKSGTVSVTLLFVGLLGAFALGNEFLKTRYDQLRFNVAIYYFLLLTYCIIAVPTFVLHSVGTLDFLLSGAASLVVISVFLLILSTVVFRTSERRQVWEVGALVGMIFLIFNGLYFLNVIPPVPLSLKTVGVYHSLIPIAPDAAGHIYEATYEPPAWFVFWRDTAATYTYEPGQPAYCYSAVFAPGSLATTIVHRWEKYDEATKRWGTEALASFPISGGRAQGYRGYSIERDLSPGQWRCDIETAKGALIGRLSFSVVEGSSTPALSTVSL